MCCDLCPEYDRCTLEDKLKEECCRKCPDYNSCKIDEQESDFDNSGEQEE